MTDDDARAYRHLRDLARVPEWVAIGDDVGTFIAAAVCDRDRLVQEVGRLRAELAAVRAECGTVVQRGVSE